MTTMTAETIGPPLVAALQEALRGLLPPPAADAELRLYTPAEAAALLGVTENWVTERVKSRRVPFTLIGRFPRFSASHIRAITEMGEINPTTRRPKRRA